MQIRRRVSLLHCVGRARSRTAATVHAISQTTNALESDAEIVLRKNAKGTVK